MRSREELEEWVQSQVEALANMVHTLAKIAKSHPQLSHSRLGVSLQLEWHYQQMTVPKVYNLMLPIKTYQRKTFFPTLFRGGG